MISEEESLANRALTDALKALQRATELCELAGYGSQVLGPLADAQRDLQYAYDTAIGA